MSNGIHEGMCDGKQRYPNRHVAQQAIDRHAIRPTRGTRLNVYRCGVCRHWHVGHCLPSGRKA